MLTQAELQNFYRLLESKDPTMVELALEMAAGMHYDWGEADYHAWHHLIEESKLISRGYEGVMEDMKMAHHDLFYVLAYIHQQHFFAIHIESEAQVLPGHSDRFINLKKLKVNSKGSLRPLLQDKHLMQFVYELNFKEQGLSSTPEALAEFKSTQKIDLSHNALTELPDSISELKELRSLHVQFNQLSGLPESMQALQNLSTLWIAKNQFKALPAWLPELKNLRMCYVFDNPWAENCVVSMQGQMPWCMFFDR